MIQETDGIRQSAEVYVSMQRVPKYAQYPNTQQYPNFLKTKIKNPHNGNIGMIGLPVLALFSQNYQETLAMAKKEWVVSFHFYVSHPT